MLTLGAPHIFLAWHEMQIQNQIESEGPAGTAGSENKVKFSFSKAYYSAIYHIVPHSSATEIGVTKANKTIANKSHVHFQLKPERALGLGEGSVSDYDQFLSI